MLAQKHSNTAVRMAMCVLGVIIAGMILHSVFGSLAVIPMAILLVIFVCRWTMAIYRLGKEIWIKHKERYDEIFPHAR